MKKALLLMFMAVISAMMLMAEPIDLHVNGDEGEVLSGETELYLNWLYEPEKYYRFMFSDRYYDKNGSFEDIFSSPGIDWINISKLESGHLVSDKNLYVYWQVDGVYPIDRLTLEIPAPLVKSDMEQLDWYASIDGKDVMGGEYGYGEDSIRTIYSNKELLKDYSSNRSVQLKIWTENIQGKGAGTYYGSIILKVYGEND